MALRLHERLAGRLEREGMRGVYEDLERPLIAVLARMEQARPALAQGTRNPRAARAPAGTPAAARLQGVAGAGAE